MDGQQFRAVTISNAGIASNDTEGLTLATLSALGEHHLAFKAAADGAAGDATAEAPIGRMITNGRVIACYYIPAAALTGDATNNATLTVSKRTAGGAATTLATITTTASWTAWVPVALTVSTQSLAAGDAITFSITKNGTGVVVPLGRLQLEVVRSAEISSYTQS